MVIQGQVDYCFKCKDLGELNKVLNMGIMRTANGGLFVLQASYVCDVLKRFKEHVPSNASCFFKESILIV